MTHLIFYRSDLTGPTWYMYHHIYNRGAHKAPIFLDSNDYWRFLKLLYISNSTRPFKLAGYPDNAVFSADRVKTIVTITAYCLMPNHFHIVLAEDKDGNITKFMRKLCTGYSVYYNVKYKHSGTIFQGKYKSKPVADDLYYETVLNYVHLNPYGLEEPVLEKSAYAEYFKQAFECSKRYEYSSFKDYLGEHREQGAILQVGPDRSDLTGVISSPALPVSLRS